MVPVNYRKMKIKTSIFCLLFAGLALAAAFRIRVKTDVTNNCVKCHETDPNKINVHLVHHSHDDVGWLKTVDQYFWGLNYTIVNVGVQYIITSVVNALWEHPDRRFIQVETAFFWKWWKSQDDVMRNKFKTLVDNGQLEIINGGWVMNDEACVNYQSTIDQFTWGFRILNDTLGQCGQPTIGWQIDPFGHSREHASLLSKIGFDGLFFARLDMNDREQRKNDSNMDFLWKTSANNDDSVVFGSMFGPENVYYPPAGFCFDVLCGDDSIDDDPEDDAYNVNEKATLFAENIKSYVKYYKTNNVLITMGGDFQYQAAEINFQNSDRLIKAFENNTEIKLIYSTPSCYLKSVYDAQPALVTKTDDFFPYGSADHTYWAGYFTSRQNFKRFERQSHNILQVAKQLTTIVSKYNSSSTVDVSPIKGLREAIGVMQHHDAITGTEKQHVARDYTKILARAVTQAEDTFTDYIGKLLGSPNLSSLTKLSSCILANMSICNTTQSSDGFIVVVYNPLAWPVTYTIRLPIDDYSTTVRPDKWPIIFDILEPISNFSYVQLDNVQPAKYELNILASEVPPLGTKVYHVHRVTDAHKTDKGNGIVNQGVKYGNEKIGFEIENSNGLLKSITMNGRTVEITQEFLYYTSHNGTNETDPSGAYIFRPVAEAIPFSERPQLSATSGFNVDEVRQTFNDFITQIIRVYKGSNGTQNYIEFDWLIGPLDISDDHGIEIITRYTVKNFKNERTFYTDSNGREMIKRVLNYRPTYSYDSSIEPIASNYYPVTSKIRILDEEQDLQVSILNDRSQGGSSLNEGEIELMLHRRTLRDDSKGVEEPMNETEFGQGIVARGQHYLVLGPISGTQDDGKTVTAQERTLAQEKLLQPWVGVGDASKLSIGTIDYLISTSYSALKKSLPENINILTLEPWTETTYLLRLEHILEKNEDPNLSSEVTIDLAELFADFTITNVVETTLGANKNLDSIKSKNDWSYGSDKVSKKSSLGGTKVVLAPMDIKTFIVELTE